EGPSQSNLHPQNYPPVAQISVASGQAWLEALSRFATIHTGDYYGIRPIDWENMFWRKVFDLCRRRSPVQVGVVLTKETEWEVVEVVDSKNREEVLALVHDSLTMGIAALEVPRKETKDALDGKVMKLQKKRADTWCWSTRWRTTSDGCWGMRMRHAGEVKSKVEEKIDLIDLLTVALKEANVQREELCSLSENKVVRKEETIEETKDQKLAYAQCAVETDKGTISSAIG
ncbi:hypothetical protein BKA70DRAFT_1466284, partial [Coprinopsis sp. MPI-PUGE-AT-0042]